MTEEGNWLFEEVAFLWDQFQFCFPESTEDWTQLFHFRFKGRYMYDVANFPYTELH